MGSARRSDQGGAFPRFPSARRQGALRFVGSSIPAWRAGRFGSRTCCAASEMFGAAAKKGNPSATSGAAGCGPTQRLAVPLTNVSPSLHARVTARAA